MKFPFAKAVFLDRDGLINAPVIRNGRPGAPWTVEEFNILPDVRKGCSLLANGGYLLVVVTNQPDIGRSPLSNEVLLEMHNLMCRMLPIRRVEVNCDPEDTPHSIRQKPNPGMLFRAAEDLAVDLSRSYMVGDSWRNMECGRRAGCRTVYVDRKPGMRVPPLSDMRARDLLDAARQILETDKPRSPEDLEWRQTSLK